MITKITKIKNLGLVFQDFSWETGTEAFKECNLIYGWNGSGKTTLTRLFHLLGSSHKHNSEFEAEYQDSEFEVEYQENQNSKNQTTRTINKDQLFPCPVRVFNQDYIEQNIDVKKSAANTISMLLGRENVELAQQIEADRKTLHGAEGEVGVLKQINDKKAEKKRLEKAHGKHFTDIARPISEAIAGSASATRNYNKNNAENDYKTIPRNVLSDQTLEKTRQTLRQEAKETLALVSSDDKIFDSLQSCFRQAEALCQETAVFLAIERLVENPDIARWVENGQKIHHKHDPDTCEYCRQTIPRQ